MKVVTTNSVEETWDVAEAFATDDVHPRTVIALHGDLGSGKTTFVTGIARSLKIYDPITSPTFTLIKEYYGLMSLFHMDLYRISGPDELTTLGVYDYLLTDGVSVIEWPERAGDLLPPDTIHIYFEFIDENRRKITIKNSTP